MRERSHSGAWLALAIAEAFASGAVLAYQPSLFSLFLALIFAAMAGGSLYYRDQLVVDDALGSAFGRVEP